jgi:hypothetical protein
VRKKRKVSEATRLRKKVKALERENSWLRKDIESANDWRRRFMRLFSEAVR